MVIVHTRPHAHELHARNTHMNTCSHTRTQHSHVHTLPRTHATLTCTHARMHAHTTRPTHTLTLKFSTYTCMHTHQALTDTYTTRWFPCRVGVLSCLHKFVFIWPFSYANCQVGPTRNMVNLTSQHGATRTIWPVNRVQSVAER